jgi:hypothetical protein
LTSDHDLGPTTVQLSAAAHRVAAIAAGEADIPLSNWIALAIMGTAAEQAGVGPQAIAQPVAGPPPEPEPVEAALRRLEAKLDRALAAQPPGGPAGRY